LEILSKVQFTRKKDNIVANTTKGAVHEEKDNVASLYWPEDSKSLGKKAGELRKAGTDKMR